ncbi:MAG: hypothetical protein M1826_001475 [Phylliscum demangeonii]|nr:MAG: hypothetical protein M1826_001475 [Phylliscum demangeonii]
MSLDNYPPAFTSAPAARRTNLRPSTGISLNLASNNPFRNHLSSAPAPSPSPPFQPATSSPLSSPPQTATGSRTRNPFLDWPDYRDDVPIRSGSQPPPLNDGMASASHHYTVESAARDLNGLALNDVPRTNGIQGPPPPPYSQRDRPPVVGHRPSRSHEEEGRPHRVGPPSSTMRSARPAAEFADGYLPREHRPVRRNSESSVAGGRSDRPEVDPSRHRDGRPRDRRHRAPPPASYRPKQSSRRLDVIDKLDVTSIYGTGLFHHDGPFDACNPNRNRKGSLRAPMHAFAKDSANSVLGGSGPIHKDIDHALFFGDRGAEAFSDFSSGAVERNASETAAGDRRARPRADRSHSFDPVARADPVHGDETLGLGTSTFLEGAPAPRAAIQRRDSEAGRHQQHARSGSFGLSRKRSLAQRIKGITPNRTFTHSVAVKSPGAVDPAGPASPGSNGNPFFSSHDAAYDAKSARIGAAERERASAGAVRPSSSARGSTPPEHVPAVHKEGSSSSSSGSSSKGRGFLSRMRSLRGGRRARATERT